MALDPKAFKAYDVRGIYPSELDEAGAYAIGRAYVEQFEPKAIAVGHDARVSSPSMASAVIQGATDGGAEVKDVGMIGTEMLYFGVGELDLDGAVRVTARHNPKEYTGTKIVRRGALPVGGDSGLLDIRDRAREIESPELVDAPPAERVDIYPAFVEPAPPVTGVDKGKPLRVVIDAGNGMEEPMLPPILERLPLDAVPCFFE